MTGDGGLSPAREPTPADPVPSRFTRIEHIASNIA